jgi:hypothetical protein
MRRTACHSSWSQSCWSNGRTPGSKRPGLVETSHEDGWDLFDPDSVLAVEWMAREGEGGGLYL